MITKSSRATVLFTACICGFSALASAQTIHPNQLDNLIPPICPADAGGAVQTHGSTVKSEPLVVNTPTPPHAAVTLTDAIKTPGYAAKDSVMTVNTPSLSDAAIPDALKKPITLEQAIQLAFQNSPNITSVLASIEASKGSVDASSASFNPVFSLSGAATVQGPTSAAVESFNPTLGLSLTLPLDISKQLRFSSDIAKMKYQQQYLSMLSVSEQLILQVKSAYYDLLRSSGQLAVQQAAVDDAKLRLENIKAKRAEGTVPQFDVTTIEVEFENLNQQLLSAQTRVQLAQSAFNLAMGVDVNYPTQVVANNIEVAAQETDIAKATDQAMAKRPDVKSAQIAIALGQKSTDLASLSDAPTASLSGSGTYLLNPSAMASDDYSWSATLRLNIPISDGGAKRANVRQAKAGVQSSIAALTGKQLAVSSEVRSAALSLQTAAIRTKTTESAVSLAKDALSIANDRYDAGIATQVEVSNAQTQLTQARYNYINALFDYAVASAQLEKATSAQPEMNNLQLLSETNNMAVNKEPNK